ncbi:MAG: CRISPR-associated protein Cse2 [Firmicutes bacterium]|nr:CRISPR-associated protein Cse2 [Bacillota bacterium]
MTLDTSAAEVFLAKLASLTKGEIAVLRRNAGTAILGSRKVYGIFYRILPPTVDSLAEEYFLIATLYGFNKLTFIGDFGETMRRVRQSMGTSLDRRFTTLLEGSLNNDGAHPGELAFRLRQCIMMAASDNVGVDWRELLYDILLWRSSDKSVQKKWAKSYFSDQDSKNEGVNIYAG